MQSHPAPNWPLIDIFRPPPRHVIEAMRSDTLHRVNYLTSRLRAAITACMDRPLEDRNALYDMLTLELNAAFVLIGQAALEGAHIAIPRLMRAVGQTHFGPYVCPDFTLTDGFRAELQQPLAATDPTRIFESYHFDWWNNPKYVYGFESGNELERAFRYHMEMYYPGGISPLMPPDRHQTSAFSESERCAGQACRRLLGGVWDTVRSLQVLVDEMGDKQEQREAQTKERLEAMETLRAAYIEYNRPLEDRDIRPLSERTACINTATNDLTYIEREPSEPTLGLQTNNQPMVPSHTESKPPRPQKVVNRPGIDSEDCSSDGF